MRILWLVNIELPIVSKELKNKIIPYGGWLDVLSMELLKQNHDLICVCHSNNFAQGTNGHLTYYNYGYKKNIENYFSHILIKEKPDIIHVWGTEYPHSFCMMKAVSNLNFVQKTIISIQGLVSICARHYYEGLPIRIIYGFTFRDLLRLDNIKLGQLKFIKRGKTEIKAIKIAEHIIGRTDWDRACTQIINPASKYYFCNEILRESFYYSKWELEKINRHSIFVSQCSYPIKGFHYVLEAMPFILKKYPDMHVYTTGFDLLHLSFIQRLKLTTYQKYLLKLIKKNNLEKHISFLGELSEQQMVFQYTKTHVFVSASTIENSSNSIGEAMLIGCPVVCSDVGGIKNLMQHGTEGFIYQSTEPYMIAYYVDKIFSSDILARDLSKKSRMHAMITHSKSRNIHQLMEIYKEIIIK